MKVKSYKKRQLTGLIIAFVAFAVFAYGAWYAYCHYYPLLENGSSGSDSAEMINKEFRFGDVNSTHLSAAREKGIEPVTHRTQLQTKSLKKIESCNLYKVDNLTYSVPYLTHSSAGLLEEIGTRFQTELKQQGFEKHRIVVSSMLRTGDDVKRLREINGNATTNSAHLYATTFDITYIRFDRLSLKGESTTTKQLANILGNVLKQLRSEGFCYVKYESKQRCFHITSRK